MITLAKTSRAAKGRSVLAVINDPADLRAIELGRSDRQYIAEQLAARKGWAVCNISGRLVMVHLAGKDQAPGMVLERARRAGNAAANELIGAMLDEAVVMGLGPAPEVVLAVVEGAVLGAYEFRKYKTSGKPASLKKLAVVDPKVAAAALEDLGDRCEAVHIARDLVNEPASFLSAVQLGAEIRTLAKRYGFKAQVMEKAAIEAQGMGGLLAVNKGSLEPPTFSVMEWKPRNAVNKRPIVLVGKGVVYDTGGLSLKPTPNSMDHMKCDMAGAAAVAGALAVVAARQLPVHVVGVVPATDNRPGGNAYAPGDIVRMHSGLTVEVLNTDAEGRIILADALSYAERFDAELVISIATLTGAAMRAIGTYGSVVMGTASEDTFEQLDAAGAHVFERLARMPFWEEYDEEIKSDIADIKNLGSDLAGQITAGKFLARFTTRPYVHIDIAATAFLDRRDHYRPKGGTGVGVRLFHEFIKRRAERKKP